MKTIWPKIVVLLVAVVLVSGALCSLDAQQGSEPAATAEDPLLIEFRELFKAAEEKKQEYDRIEGEITAAAGEDKKAFKKRASELAVDLVNDVQKLAAIVVAREEEGQDASADRERVAEILQRVSRSARDAIGRLEIDMVFGISYSDDIPHAERVLGEILGNHEKVLEDPEPMVRLHNLGESSVDFVVRPWVKTDDYWEVYWDVTREVKIRFDAEGISIPFPQRDVHLIEEKATESA